MLKEIIGLIFKAAPVTSSLVVRAAFSDDIEKKMKEEQEMERYEQQIWEARQREEREKNQGVIKDRKYYSERRKRKK